jgi:enoyl-CoA hydratase
MLSPVVTKIRGPAAVLQFNQAAERNPLSIATLDVIEDSLNSLFSMQEVKVLIFTGTDDVFASGANIRELAQLDSESARAFARRGQRLFSKIASAKQTTIAAINGYCMGGALDLALACDIRIASTNAVFAHPGARLGIITGWGGTQRLPRIIGKTRALEFFITARRVNSGEALEMGLVSRICDPVLECALEFAQRMQRVNTASR